MQPEPARQLLPASNIDRHDAAAGVLLLVIAILIALTVRHYGISNDEDLQHRYGEMIIAYYTSGFADRSLFKFDNLYLYGGLFDVAAILIAKVLSTDVFLVCHVLCALIGLGGIVAAWATARLIAGPRAGLIAAALLAACGVWYGGMFNHTKDVPFAAAMIGGTYALVRATRDLPYPRKRDVLLFGLMLGAALGIRVMGLLLGIYLALAILAGLWISGARGHRDRLAFIGRSLLAFAPALLLAYLMMIAAWPWAALDPFNPVRAIFAFADFHYNIRDLFAGQVYPMAEMPRWYLPTYVVIKLPPPVFIGALLALGFAATPRGLTSRTRLEIAFVAFTVVFPVACQVIGRGPIFSGMRHFIFIVPPLAVLAGIGCHLLLEKLKRWGRSAAIGGVTIAVMLLLNAGLLVRLHPHQYLYYNPLVGGLAGANGRYATDYWFNTMPEAVRALEWFLAQSGETTDTHYVAICGERRQFEHIAGPRLRFTDDWDKAEFFVSTTHMACENMLEGRVIAFIERLGVVLAVVKDRRAIIAPASR